MLKRSKTPRVPGVAKLKEIRREIAAMTPAARRRAKRRTAAAWLAAGLTAGGAMTYFFDPSEGRDRRARVQSRVSGVGRRAGARASMAGRRVSSTMGRLRGPRATVQLPEAELIGAPGAPERGR